MIAATLLAGCATALPPSVSVRFRPAANVTEREDLGFLGPVATVTERLEAEDRASWTFDPEGRLVEHVEMNRSLSTTEVRRERVERDPAGRRVRMVRSTAGLGQTDAVDREDTTYRYGTGPAPIEESDHTLPQGTETERRVLLYDGAGRLLELWSYAPGGRLKTLEVRVLDARGLIVERQFLVPDEGPLETSLIDGLLRGHRDGFVVADRWRYSYDGDGVHLEVQGATCNGVTAKEETFDYAGNRMEWRNCEDRIRPSAPAYARHSNYRYEARGNWTERKDCPGPYQRIGPNVDLASIHCPSGSLVRRTITYFEAAPAPIAPVK